MRLTRKQIRHLLLREMGLLTEKRDPNSAFQALVKEMENPGGFITDMQEQM